MQSLQIDEKKARGLYKGAAPEFKAMLIDSFGEKFFSEKTIDRIKTFADACEEMGISPNDAIFSTGTPDEIAYKKLKVVRNALNPKGWVADWNNNNQRKWAPWFYLNVPGFRFLASFYDVSDTYATGGSRLCYESQELCDYAAAQFIDLYKQWLS